MNLLGMITVIQRSISSRDSSSLRFLFFCLRIHRMLSAFITPTKDNHYPDLLQNRLILSVFVLYVNEIIG